MMFKHYLSCLNLISRNFIFSTPQIWRNRSGITKVPVHFRISSMDYSKEHQKLWESKLELIYFMILGQRYRESKGVPEYRLEDPPLSQSGATWWPGGGCFAPYAHTARSKSYRTSQSTSRSKVASSLIVMAASPGSRHPHRYVQLAVNRQPGHRQVNS